MMAVSPDEQPKQWKQIEFEAKTWVCDDCDYKQDFDPNDRAKMRAIFDGRKPVGQCPSCGGGNIPVTADSAKKIRFKMTDPTDVDNEVEIIKGGASDEAVEKVRTAKEKADRKAELEAKLAELRSNPNLEEVTIT